LPSWVTLGKAGTAWWRWAWKTPQAAGWASGHESAIARRASLEDDLATIAEVDSVDALGITDADSLREVRTLVGRLAALVTGRLAICKEMRELDNLLGLTPKGMAALRWVIVDDTAAAEPARQSGKVASMEDARRSRLMADGS
jgi:hypothetical protein